jgi:hypothetical protein
LKVGKGFARQGRWLAAFVPATLAGCYNPHVVNEQDAYSCEAQGFRAGSDANVNCAIKRAMDREQSGTRAVEQVVAMEQQPAAPLPPSHRGGVSQITPIDVAFGASAVVNFSFSANADCTVDGLPTLRIVKQPAHGTVRVTPREDYAISSPGNFLESCGDRKVSGMSLDYTPAKGYSGADLVEFETTTKTGIRHFTAPITVAKPQRVDNP